MEREALLEGVIVPTITPLNKDRDLDLDGWGKLISFLIDGGVSGLFIGGTTGEFASLPVRVRRKALREAIAIAEGRVHLYYGVSHSSTEEAINECRFAQEYDIDAIVTTPPFYFTFTQDEIEKHYTMLAQETSLPLIIYNIPGTTRNSVDIKTLKSLSEIENIVGIKDTTKDMIRFERICHVFRNEDNFKIAQGTEELMFLSLQAGADGLVAGIANIWPDKCVELFKSFKSGDTSKSYAIQLELLEVFKIYEIHYFLGALKAALAEKGICQPYVSYPFSELRGDKKRKIIELLKRHGVL